MAIRYKIAATAFEFQQIHELNYATFVEEIAQHKPRAERALVDRFHHENIYFIALDHDTLVGMVALRDGRPFSLDAKLPDLDRYLGGATRPCEIRLLAIRPSHRGRRVLHGLAVLLAQRFFEAKYDAALVSGTVRQQRLYLNLGFEPFGPLVGTAQARYQPMLLRRGTLLQRSRRYRVLQEAATGGPVNLLPGPAPLSAEVQAALAAPPLSHRTPEFQELYNSVCSRLTAMTGAARVAVVLGSGTLANDIVAGQLSLLEAPGVVLVNGEFGERLVDHARRWRLDFQVVAVEWSGVFDEGAIETTITKAGAHWLWAVHCETSTGVLNDLDMLRGLCERHQLKLCLDAISSLGMVPVDLRGVYLATGVSNKWLQSTAGLALVFANHLPEPQPTRVPRYLDLGLSLAGVPFTHNSNLLAGLDSALQQQAFTNTSLIQRLRRWCEAQGLTVVTPQAYGAPAVLTLAVPETCASFVVGEYLASAGYQVAYRSSYLAERNWLQLCLIGDYDARVLRRLPALIATAIRT